MHANGEILPVSVCNLSVSNPTSISHFKPPLPTLHFQPSIPTRYNALNQCRPPPPPPFFLKTIFYSKKKEKRKTKNKMPSMPIHAVA